MSYVLVGGLAVGAWGIPRATADVDVIAVIDAARASAFAAALRAEGLDLDERDLVDALSDRSHVTISDPRTQYHIDLKPALTPDEVRQARAAIAMRTPNGELRIASAEDTVAYKLLYGSPQDLADARSILIRQRGRLDLPRLREIARDLDVTPQLDAMLREIDDP